MVIMKRLIPVILALMFEEFRKMLFIFFLALLYIMYGSLGSGLLIAPASAAPPPGWTAPPTELLIIVPYKEPSDEARQVNEDWITEGRRLRNYKQTSGLGAVVKSLNDINSDYEGRDEPERIKRAIYENALDPGIKYVMLVGGADLMPVRYQYAGYDTGGATYYSNSENYCRDRYCDEDGTDCTGYCTEHPDHCDGEGRIRWCPYELYGFVPNDGYYANLWDNDDPSRDFDDWDNDGDGFFGELYRDNYREIDGNTMHPDVVVGRVPVRTPEEFSTYIDKIMAYENGIDGMRRSDAYRKVLLMASDLGSRNHRRLGDDLGSSYEITYLTLEGDTFSIQHPDGSEETTSTPEVFISDFIDTNTPHFVGYGGHGSPNCWCEMNFGWRHAAGLTNELPVIAAAASCSTAKLADPLWYMEPPPIPVTTSETPAQSMADAFLGRSYGGAVVYVGAVTTSRGGANHLERRFFRAISDGARTAGDAWLNAVEGYIANHNLDLLAESDWHDDSTHPDGGYWERLPLGDYNRMHFFGDPSLRRDGEEGWDDAPLTTSARYVRRVHVDPYYRYQRIVFDAADKESDALTTRYRYRTGKPWSPWLSGSEFYLPLPASPRDAICEAVVEYYSVDRFGNREPVKEARVVYEYPKGKELTRQSSKITAISSLPNPASFNVKGKVVDEKGRPLWAALTLNNKANHWKTQTNAQGWYVFSAVPSGNYDLKITQAPAGYRQFTPDNLSYKIVVQRSSVERGFVFVREDHVAPTMTQELPWDVAATSGCIYGLAYDDWYGRGVKDVKLAITDAKGRWLSAQETWQEKEVWFKPQYVMPLGKYLESGVGERAYKRLPKKFWHAERTELESISCQLDAKCSPHIWIHCLSNSSLLSEGLKIVRGKVKDGAGNSSQMSVRSAIDSARYSEQ